MQPNNPPQPPHYAPAPPHGYYPTQVVYVPSTKTSGLAVAGMVLGILWLYWIGSILAVIFGHIAYHQTGKNPNLGGRGMAIAAIVLGWIGVGTLCTVLLLAAGSSGS